MEHLGAWLMTLADSLTAAIPAVQERAYDWGWGMHPMWWMWGTGGLVMMAMMLGFWGLVIAGIVLGIRWLVRQGRGSEDSAREILRQRYARGEINREEFEARGQDLLS